MRNRRIRVLHEGAEYYLVDRGRTSASRVLTFLKPLQREERAAVQGEFARVKTDLGECAAVASWTRGELLLDKQNEELRAVFLGIVERYLEEFRVGRQRAGTRTYYFLSVDRMPLYALAGAHPSGLAVLVYDSEKAAQASALARRGIEAREIEVEAIQDLHDFLCARATDGFSGALLDEHDPIYFCLDESGAPRYLRLGLDEASGRLVHMLLRADGEWTAYDGEEDLTPHLDQDVVDQHMLDRLGEIPFLGFHDGARFLRLARAQDPAALVCVSSGDDDGDGQCVCPIFVDREIAHSYQQEHGLDACTLVEIDDLGELTDRAERELRVVHLHPDSHRARGGVLWRSRGRVVLDSFSGIWTSRDGRTFAREAATPPPN